LLVLWMTAGSFGQRKGPDSNPNFSFHLGQMELRHTSLRLLSTPPHLISYLAEISGDFLLHFSISPKARKRALRIHLGQIALR
jgi:hypothetical protein